MTTACDPHLVILRPQAPITITRDDRGAVVVPTPEHELVTTPTPSERVVILDVEQQLVTTQPQVRTVTVIGTCGPCNGGGVGTGDLYYLHTQAIPNDTWVIVHNLGKYPAVTVMDSGGGWVVGQVRHDSVNQCTLFFAVGFSGKAALD